jgi:hypothetical protein
MTELGVEFGVDGMPTGWDMIWMILCCYIPQRVIATYLCLSPDFLGRKDRSRREPNKKFSNTLLNILQIYCVKS